MLAAGRVALSVMCPFRRRWVHGEALWQLYRLALDSRVPISLHWMRGLPRPIKSVQVVSRCKHFCGLAVGCCMFAVSLQWMPPAGLVCLSGSAPKVSPAPRARKSKALSGLIVPTHGRSHSEMCLPQSNCWTSNEMRTLGREQSMLLPRPSSAPGRHRHRRRRKMKSPSFEQSRRLFALVLVKVVCFDARSKPRGRQTMATPGVTCASASASSRRFSL